MKKILLFICIASLSLNAQEKKHQSTIAVSGEGTVKVVPDQVVLNIRVEHSGNTAKEVKTMNDAAVNKVLQFCKKMKIDPKDIATQYINLNKSYDRREKKYHYKANQAIRILLRDLKKYESLAEGLLDSGVNRIDGIQFKNSQLKKYKSEARKKAIQNARQKALEYATALQQNIGKAISISENGASAPPVMARSMQFNMATDEANTGGPAIAPGEMTISAKVNVVFELK